MTHVDLVVFDADHTLYTPRSDRAYEDKFAYLSKETGAEIEDLRRSWERRVERAVQSQEPGPHERKRLIAETIEAVGGTPDEDLVAETYTVFWDTVTDNLENSTDTAGIVRRLRDSGFPVAVASDEEPEALRLKLNTVFRSRDFTEFFDMVVTRRDVGKRKPSRAFYTPILESFSVAPGNAVMVGDSWVRDLKPAKDLGMRTVLLLNEERDNDEGAPDVRIEELKELEELLHGDD